MDLSTTGLVLFGLGLAVWLFGNRLWLLGAGAGALLGFALIEIFPSMGEGNLGLLIVVGLAVALGVLALMGKAFTKMLAWGVGFVIGGGLALSLVGMLGIASGGMEWLAALVAGLIGAVLCGRFLNWALILFASLLGSMLLVRGCMALFPGELSGSLGTLIVGALTAVGIFYHYRKERPAQPAPPA